MDLQLVFTSTTGRSGTGYLANIINTNAKNASAEHDPYPRGYGDPIRWYDNFERDKLIKLAKKKITRLKRGKRYGKMLNLPLVRDTLGRGKKQSKSFLRLTRRLRNRVSSYIALVDIKEIYLESTHAFTKSFGEEMYLLNPQLSLIHLVRNPLHVAKSFYNRGSIPDPKNIYLLDPNFKRNELKIISPMSDFQKCLWYWFETELRHQRFIKKYDVEKVIDIDIEELNDEYQVRKMFKILGITFKQLKLSVDRNINIEPTILSAQDLKDAKQFVDTIPDWVFDRIGDKYSLRSYLSIES
ncbi:MAG: sulfotransferase domain-containing protein [Promethearchaeota archaeon]